MLYSVNLILFGANPANISAGEVCTGCVKLVCLLFPQQKSIEDDMVYSLFARLYNAIISFQKILLIHSEKAFVD